MKKNRNLKESLAKAIEGLYFIWRTHKHYKLEIFFAILAILLSIYLKLSKIELAIVLMAIFLVLITEAINTSIEELGNLLTKYHSYSIKIVKDIAAAAVLLSIIFSLVVGYLVLFQKLLQKIY